MNSAVLHNSTQLAIRLAVAFPGTVEPPALLLNGTYCAVTRAWVEGPFAKYFSDYLRARDDLQWRVRGNQCEHFALRALLEAVYLFGHDVQAGVPAEAESIAVAAVSYHRDSGGGHEVNVWLIDGEWLAWEPQTQKFFEFSPTERASVKNAILA